MPDKPKRQKRRRRMFGPTTLITLVAAIAIYTWVGLRPYATTQYRRWSLLRQLKASNFADRIAIQAALAREIRSGMKFDLDRARDDPDPRIRELALTLTIESHWGSIKAYPKLLIALSDRDASVRESALFMISRFHRMNRGQISASERRASIQKIQALIDDRDAGVRSASIQALSSLPTEYELYRETLESATNDPDRRVRAAAWTAIFEVDPDLDRRFLAMHSLLRDPQFEHWEFDSTLNLFHLKNIQSMRTSSGLDLFLNDLGSGDERTRELCVEALARLSRSFIDSSASAIDLSRSDNNDFIMSMDSLISRKIVPALLRALGDPAGSVRLDAAGLIALEPYATHVVDQSVVDQTLFNIVMDKSLDKSTRGFACRRLVSHLPKSLHFFQDLITSDSIVIEGLFHDEILSELTTRGTDAETAIPYLLKLARRSGRVRNLAYLALHAIDPAAIDAIESRDSNEKTRDLVAPDSKNRQTRR